MMTMTGLERIAPSQSKFVNIFSSPSGFGWASVRVRRSGELRHPVFCGGDQLFVLRVMDDVAVRLDRSRELAARLVQKRQPGERREPEWLVQVRAVARHG